MSKALIFTAFLTPCRGSAYAVEIGVKQKIALRFADGVKNDRHGIGGRVLDIALVLPELPLHGLEDGAVQIPQAGAHIGLGQDSLPDPIFLGIKQPLNGILICPLSSRQVRYLKVSDKNTYISFWSVGIFMHTISLYIF